MPLLACVITTAATSGLQSSAAYSLSNQRLSTLWVWRVTAGSAGTLALLGGAALLCASLLLPDQSHWMLWAAAAQVPVALAWALAGIPLGRGQVGLFNLILLIPPSVTLLGFITILLVGIASLDAFWAVWWGAQVCAAAFAMLCSRFAGSTQAGAKDFGSIAAFLRFGVTASAGGIASLFNWRVDAILVAVFRSRREVGLYSVALQFAEALWLIGQSAAVAVYERLGRSARDAAISVTARVLRHTTLMMSIVAIGALVGAGPAIRLVMGNEFAAAVGPARIVIAGAATAGSASIVSIYFTNHLGRPRVSVAMLVVAGSVNLVACLTLIPMLGIYGAAIGTTSSYIVQGILALAWFRRATGSRWRDVLIIRRGDLRDYSTSGRRKRALW